MAEIATSERYERCNFFLTLFSNSFGAEPNQFVLRRFQAQREKAWEDSQFHETASILRGSKPHAAAAILVSCALRGCINHSPSVPAAGKAHLSRREREAQPVTLSCSLTLLPQRIKNARTSARPSSHMGGVLCRLTATWKTKIILIAAARSFNLCS